MIELDQGTSPPGSPGRRARPGLRSAALSPRLLALAVAQVVGWGALFFGPIVVAPAVASATGWALTDIMVAFAGGTVVSALAGVGVGRLIDRGNPRLVVSCSVAIGTVALVIASLAPSLPVLALAFLVAGFGQAGCLYQSTFAIIVKRHGDARRMPMTVVTIAGGLSSTLFAPLVIAIVPLWGWRGVFAVSAVVLAATIPMHLLTLERQWPATAPASGESRARGASEIFKTPRFWILVVASAALVCAMNTATLSIIPLMTEKGASYEFAALTFGLVGAAQILGRVFFLSSPRGEARPWVPLAILSATGAVVLALLAVIPGPLGLLLAVAIAAGALRGAQTLINASAVVDRWGSESYGSINGIFIGPATITTALAPALGPLLAAGMGSYALMALAMAGVLLFAAAISRWA